MSLINLSSLALKILNWIVTTINVEYWQLVTKELLIILINIENTYIPKLCEGIPKDLPSITTLVFRESTGSWKRDILWIWIDHQYQQARLDIYYHSISTYKHKKALRSIGHLRPKEKRKLLKKFIIYLLVYGNSFI